LSASDNLSEQLFHASGANLKVGDVVTPTSKYRVAHATTSRRYAIDFGEAQTHPNIYEGREVEQPALFGAVYTVEPVDHDEMKKTTGEETDIRNEEKNPDVPAESHMRFSKKGFKITGLHHVTNNYKSWGVSNHEKRNR
jgi:hypothetical protein